MFRLRSRFVARAQFTSDGIVGLVKCKQLRVLNVAFDEGITDWGIADIARHCHLLKSLNLKS